VKCGLLRFIPSVKKVPHFVHVFATAKNDGWFSARFEKFSPLRSFEVKSVNETQD
jgi:hypothetical protein